MITAFVDLAAEGLKAFNLIETNMNRPDMVASAIAKMKQRYRDAVQAAQDTLKDPKASQTDKDHAFQFIQRIES